MAIFRSIDTQVGPTLVAAGVKKISLLDVHNNAAAARFLKFYDKATAAVIGTDVPVLTIQLGAGQHIFNDCTGQDGAGLLLFKLGIVVSATNLIADADATAPTANDVVMNIVYNPS